jgi:hypothetical protein
MSLDLMLAFKTEPTDLKELVEKQGFVLQRMAPDAPEAPITFMYRYFVPGLSRRGVWFTYNDTFDQDDEELWSLLAPGVRFVATAGIKTDDGRNGFDELVQYSIAHAIRNRYDSLLFDMYNGELI